MISYFLSMDGYATFVWAAYIFTFLSCLFLYLVTRKDMKMQEKKFLFKLENLTDEKVRTAKARKVTREILDSNLTVN